ncbi:MAG: hypothetical protein P4L53_12340 [Candidatus Obscuribacterales bacterium]|nr:hypothetical protein [Candidatus Obscuribacterales bacterium]
MTPNDTPPLPPRTESITPNRVPAPDSTAQKFLDEIHQSCSPSIGYSALTYSEYMLAESLAGAYVGSFLPGPGTIIGGGIGAALGAGIAANELNNETKACEYEKLHDLIIDQNT